MHQTPALGVEIRGVKLQELSKAALDDLALLVAERGIVGMLRLFTPCTYSGQAANANAIPQSSGSRQT